MQIPNLIEYIASGKLDGVFAMLYPDPIAARTRYIQNLIAFQGAFGEADVRLFSAPGRTEIGGNHTDHQNGCVLAAAVQVRAALPVSLRIVSSMAAPLSRSVSRNTVIPSYVAGEPHSSGRSPSDRAAS